MRGMRNQSGVAMVTVLLVAMVMTVVASAAAFSTINELKAGQDDRQGSEDSLTRRPEWTVSCPSSDREPSPGIT